MTNKHRPDGSVDPLSKTKSTDVQKENLKSMLAEAVDDEDKELVRQALNFFKHKTGWIGEDKSLPVTVDHIGKVIEKKKPEETLLDKGISYGKGAFSRALFHLKAWGTGIFMEVLTGIIPPALSIGAGATAFSSLLGMFLLFPHQVNRSATLMGLLVGLLCIGAGVWPLAIALGGLTTALIHIINYKKAPLAFFFVIPALLLILSLGIHAGVLMGMPLWFYGAAGASLLLGIIKPKWLDQLSNKLLGMVGKNKLEADKLQVLEAQKAAEEEGEFKAYPSHLKELEKMREQMNRLPEDIASHVKAIKLKTYAIMRSMNDDPRDVMPGNQFLNRYLPMLNNTLEQFAMLAQHDAQSDTYIKAKERIVRSLSDMDYAFGQAHQKLINNDVDDLLISLNVMDRLRKSDGYDSSDF